MTMTLRGIILAGGKGTRLGELTKVTNKHLLPVGPYPMVYHPLKKLVGAGIRDILLVSGTEHMGDFVELLGSGRDHGCSLTYRVQDEAGGIAQALGLGGVVLRRQALRGDSRRQHLSRPAHSTSWRRRKNAPDDAWIVLTKVDDPSRYGVAELREQRVVGIEEKPAEAQKRLRGGRRLHLPAGCVQRHQGPKAQRPRRAGDHRRQSLLPGQGPARLQFSGGLLDRRRHAAVARGGQSARLGAAAAF